MLDSSKTDAHYINKELLASIAQYLEKHYVEEPLLSAPICRKASKIPAERGEDILCASSAYMSAECLPMASCGGSLECHVGIGAGG